MPDDPLDFGRFPKAEAARRRREARGSADVTEEVRAFVDELNAGDHPAREPGRSERIAATTYSELLEDRELLDRVARALCMDCDLDYIEAFERMDEWADQVSVGRRIPPAEVTVADLLEHSSMSTSLDVLCRDVVKMEREDAGPPSAVADSVSGVVLDSSDAKVGERIISAKDVDGAGKVQLPDRSDRAFLLTDAYTIERSYLRAKELSASYVDRKAFEADYRMHTEAGLDFLATLEWANGAAKTQAALDTRDRQRRQEHHESRERRRRAGERAIEAEATERRRRL